MVWVMCARSCESTAFFDTQKVIVFYLSVCGLGVGCGSAAGPTDVTPTPSCAALDNCHQSGTYDTVQRACTRPIKADGTQCAAATLCEAARVCQQGVCQVAATTACPGGGICQLAVCDPTHGCGIADLTGPCNPNVQNIPLNGCASGDYTAAITLGDTQTFNMIMDTGSSTMAVASNTCSNCNDITPTYVPGDTAINEHQTATGAYGAASGWTGAVYSDQVSVGAPIGDIPLSFAAITHQTTSSATTNVFFGSTYCSGSPANDAFQGIFGLGNSALNAPHTTNFLDSLKAASRVPDAFAVQFCDTGGNIWFGGYDPDSITDAPQYTPMDTVSGYYKVNLQDISLGSISLGFAPSVYGAALVDTGTSVVVVTDAVYSQLSHLLNTNAAFTAYFGTDFYNANTCIAPSGRPGKTELNAALPTMTWSFKTASGAPFTITLPATSSYLTPQNLGNDVVGYCPGFMGGGGGGTQPSTIIGNSAMHSHIVIFDRANNQLGFAPQRGCL